MRSCEPSGRFVYRVHLDGRRQQAKYNVLRHAGAIYALAQLQARDPDPARRAAILRAARYLHARYADDLAGQPGVRAIFSLPGEERSDSGRRMAKLGGTGLGLVALLAARELDPQLFALEELRALGAFILHMQNPDGSFHSKLDEREGFAYDFASLYYPGEAILALVRLSRIDPDPRWSAAAGRGIAHLVRSRAGRAKLPPDHWLLIASGEYLQSGPPATPIPASEIRAHLAAIGRTMLAEGERARARDGPPGSFLADGRSTPTATRLEGLLALDAILEPGPLRSQLRAAVAVGAAFLVRCQVPAGPHRGGVLRALAPVPGADAEFLRRQREVRIDYVQHALSAWLGAAALP